jgi:hypothetical protein
MLFLWITPQVLLSVLAVVLCKRRLYREFPFFLVFVLYEIAKFILMFALYLLPGVTGEQYAYAYYATLMISIVLRFGVIDEVSKDLFCESQLLRAAARRSLQVVTGLLLVIGVLLALYASGDNSVRWVTGVSVVNRGAVMVQCGLLFSLLFFSRFLGLPWGRPAFGITLGLGVLSSGALATYALRAEFISEGWMELLNILITGAYLACVLVWMGYFLAPEVKPASLTVVPDDDEVETWNRELQQLLRH